MGLLQFADLRGLLGKRDDGGVFDGGSGVDTQWTYENVKTVDWHC